MKNHMEKQFELDMEAITQRLIEERVETMFFFVHYILFRWILNPKIQNQTHKNMEPEMEAVVT